MPSDLDRAVGTAKQFESLLAYRFGAKGRGLHEKIDSVRQDLEDLGGQALIRDLRAIATIRNKIVHEADYQRIENRADFRKRRNRALKSLQKRSSIKMIALCVLAITLAAAAVVVGRFMLG